jgi:hypothetical protein
MVISVTWREFLRHCEIPREQDQPARKGSAKLGQERFALALLVVPELAGSPVLLR